MKKKTWIPLVLALVLGVVAMFVARDMMNKNNSGPAPEPGTAIAVLNKDLAPGSAITPEDLTTTRIMGEVNTAAVFTKTEDLHGRVLTAPAIKGAPVLQAMLAPLGSGTGLQALIPEGMRAITIEINETSGIAGNLTPGARVDLVATLNGKEGEMVSRAVVQNIKVQSLGMRRAGPEGEQPAPARSVTLLVTPREAETIELAVATAKTRLLLRGSTDNDPAGTDGVTVAELRGGGTGPDPFESRPVEIVKGTSSIAPSASPSTQPTAAVTATAAPEPKRTTRRYDRQIKVIRGNQETEVTVPEFVSPVGPRWMTGVGGEELPSETN